jgi:iron(III) transport system ATP-binding protein
VQELLIDGLVKRYPGATEVIAVNNVHVEVEAGEMLVLLGPSGCGKTTLLRCVAGLENAQEGRIVLEGKTVFDGRARLNIPTHLRDIGMVFQNYSLWPHMTVRENVEYPLRARGRHRDNRSDKVQEVLEVVQCAHLADRLPSMLSGGQQQRIALARALASEPKIMLLDEPLSNLDALLRVELRAHLRAIHRKVGFTGIYVTHDQIEAFNLGTRVAVMRAGVIEQLDSARAVYERPATEYVAKFLGIRNAFEVTWAGRWVTSKGLLEGDLSLFAGLDGKTGPFQLYVRPEVLLLLPEDAPVESGRVALPAGTVSDVLYSGGVIDHVIDIGGQTVYATLASGHGAFASGSRVKATFKPQDALLYENGALLRLKSTM